MVITVFLLNQVVFSNKQTYCILLVNWRKCGEELNPACWKSSVKSVFFYLTIWGVLVSDGVHTSSAKVVLWSKVIFTFLSYKRLCGDADFGSCLHCWKNQYGCVNYCVNQINNLHRLLIYSSCVPMYLLSGNMCCFLWLHVALKLF